MMKGCEADNNNSENNISNNVSDSGRSSLCVSVTSDFINSFQEKLVYVGEPGETSEEFEKITNK